MDRFIIKKYHNKTSNKAQTIFPLYNTASQVTDINTNLQPKIHYSACQTFSLGFWMVIGTLFTVVWIISRRLKAFWWRESPSQFKGQRPCLEHFIKQKERQLIWDTNILWCMNRTDSTLAEYRSDVLSSTVHTHTTEGNDSSLFFKQNDKNVTTKIFL